MNDDKHIERWRSALRGSDSHPPVEEGPCPTSDQLWRAIRREMPAEERRSVVTHLASCAACREDWRITRELHHRHQEDGVEASSRGEVLEGPWGGFPKYAPQVAAAAAVLMVAIGLGMFFHQPPEPTFRGDPKEAGVVLENGAGAPLLEENAVLPRDHFLLSWVADAEGSTYRVKVTDAAGDPIHRSGWLEESEYLVPADELADVPSGATLYWRLEIRRPSFEERRLGAHPIQLQ